MGFPLAVLEGRRIIKNAFPLAVLLVAATSALAKKIELQVKLLDSIPTTAQYTWWTAAKASSSCEWNGASSGTGSGTGSGTITGNTVDINTETRSQTSSQGSSDCHGTAVPAMTGTSTIGGAEAKLLLPDGRIVIAGCNYKFNWGNWGNNPATKYRSCRTFTPNMYYKAEFSGNNVKIFGRRPSVDGKGKEESETYKTLYILLPGANIRPDSKPQEVQEMKTPAPEARTTIDAPSATDNSGFPSRWKSMTSGAVRVLRFEGECIYAELVLPEDSAKAGVFFLTEVKKDGDKYVGKVNGRWVRRDHGASCPVTWPVELTLVTKGRIEGRTFGPPDNAKIDWSTCSPSLPAEWHPFTWIPVR